MNKQKVLEEAIRKAIDGGWDAYEFLGAPGEPTEWRIQGNNILVLPLARGGFNAKTLSEYIFNHAFAKALWGEQPVYFVSYKMETPEGFTTSPPLQITCDQYHLQNMVISGDPIQYLADNMPKEV